VVAKRHSWQKRLLCTVEFGEEPSPVAVGAHHERCSFEFIDHRFAVCDLTELNAMLPERVFEFGHREFHLQNSWREGLTELVGLFR
jgi:hypothetical protein